MLRWRILVSAVLIPAVISLFVWDARLGPSAPVLFVICLLVSLRCGWEVMVLARGDVPLVSFGAVSVCLVLLLLATWAPHQLLIVNEERTVSLEQAYVGCVMLLMVLHVVRYRMPGGHLSALGVEVLTISYAGLLLCITAELRWVLPGAGGYLALGSLIAATKMGDIGAYTLGRLFGRRKMAPLISPGKTWMGALGAILGGVLGALVWIRIAGPIMGLEWRSQFLVWVSVYGAIIAIAGLLGDLCESLIKRDVGVKDSAELLPGFGGLLDLLDSILFAGPIGLILWERFVPETLISVSG